MQMPCSSHTLVFSRTQQKSDEYKQRRPWSKKQFLKTKVENCVDKSPHLALFIFLFFLFFCIWLSVVTEGWSKLPLHTFPFDSKVC